MTPRRALLVLSIAVLWLACNEKKAQKTPAAPEKVPPTVAETLAYAGHAKFFDANLKEIQAGPEWIASAQDSILGELSRDDAARKLQESDPGVQRAMKLLRSQLSPDDAATLKAAVIDKLLKGASKDRQLRYDWRNQAIISHYWNRRDWLKVLRPEILELIRDLGLLNPRPVTTNYINDCRAHDVPIPPDWAETGTAWVLQGTLTTNMLSPGDYAAVWTYSDPAKRGACIALPRGDGAPGSPAGIICQSATTGHACFWDNKLRSVSPEAFLGWAGQTLVIANLKDGSNLSSACTGCHHGNNVYLIAPDDPTWGRVLRGPLNGTRTLTFTTRVETSSDNTGGHPRYIPITTLPPRSGWENTFSAGTCAGSCHEQPSTSFTGPGMPPACAAGGVANCYGTP